MLLSTTAFSKKISHEEILYFIISHQVKEYFTNLPQESAFVLTFNLFKVYAHHYVGSLYVVQIPPPDELEACPVGHEFAVSRGLVPVRSKYAPLYSSQPARFRPQFEQCLAPSNINRHFLLFEHVIYS